MLDPPRPSTPARSTSEGLRVSGRAELHARASRASTDPAELPEPELVLVCCKGTDLDAVGGAPRRPLPGGDGDDAPERPRRRGDRRRARRLAAPLRGHVHERHPPLRHHVEYILDTATWIGPSRGDDAARTRGGRRAAALRGAEGEGVRRPAPGAVVEADLQRHRQRGRGADRAPARAALRRTRASPATSATSSST